MTLNTSTRCRQKLRPIAAIFTRTCNVQKSTTTVATNNEMVVIISFHFAINVVSFLGVFRAVDSCWLSLFASAVWCFVWCWFLFVFCVVKWTTWFGSHLRQKFSQECNSLSWNIHLKRSTISAFEKTFLALIQIVQLLNFQVHIADNSVSIIQWSLYGNKRHHSIPLSVIFFSPKYRVIQKWSICSVFLDQPLHCFFC